MKLIFFATALLLGVYLIQADDTIAKKAHTDESAAHKPEAPEAPEEARTDASAAHKPVPDHYQAPEMKNKMSDTKDNKSQPHSETESTKSTQQSVSQSSLTSTHSIPTTTVKPTPVVPGLWNVTDDHNNVCIVIRGIISLNASLSYVNKTKPENETLIITLQPDFKVFGDCETKRIGWRWGSFNNSLQFTFSVNNPAKEFNLGRVDGLIYFPKMNVTEGFKNDTLHAFKTPLNKSYRCGASVTLPLEKKTEKNRETEFTLMLTDFQIQAFKTSKSEPFDESIDGCPAHTDGTPDIIPIVVGCALAVLVIIVLVAYLINRRRSQAHGYLSM